VKVNAGNGGTPEGPVGAGGTVDFGSAGAKSA